MKKWRTFPLVGPFYGGVRVESGPPIIWIPRADVQRKRDDLGATAFVLRFGFAWWIVCVGVLRWEGKGNG